MSPVEKAGSWLADLADKLREDLAAAEEQARDAQRELAAGAGAEPDRKTMAFVSVCIDRAYTALESSFRRIARVVDRSTPAGDDWHQALLHQMTLAIQDARPAVLSRETVAALDPLRRHRHWLRHAYAAPFEWERMAGAAGVLPDAVARVREEVERWLAFLARQDAD